MSVSNTQEEAIQAQYRSVKAGFVQQGTTLNAWSRENGTRIQNVRDAFFGIWRGQGAAALIAKVTAAAKGDQN